jgi:hypothetical protein
MGSHTPCMFLFEYSLRYGRESVRKDALENIKYSFHRKIFPRRFIHWHPCCLTFFLSDVLLSWAIKETLERTSSFSLKTLTTKWFIYNIWYPTFSINPLRLDEHEIVFRCETGKKKSFSPELRLPNSENHAYSIPYCIDFRKYYSALT